jgi:hypothetical protein
LPSENPGQPAVFFERIKTGTAQITSNINDFFVSYNPFARQDPVKNEKKRRILAYRRTDAVARWLRSSAPREPTGYGTAESPTVI